MDNGFKVLFEISDIRSIKPTKSGEFQGNPYQASVKFKTFAIEEVEDSEFGTIDKEINLEIKISCENSELRELNLLMRTLQKEKTKFTIECSLPKNVEKDTYPVNCKLTAKEFIAKFKKHNK